jgi:transposase
MAEPFMEPIGGDVTLSYSFGHYFLILPRRISPKPPLHQLVRQKYVALDPGVRTFLAFYSPEGQVGSIGDRANERLQTVRNQIESVEKSTRKWCQHFRELSDDPRADGYTRRKKKRKVYKRRRKSARLQRRLTHLVDDLHWKTCNWLLQRFETILLPEFGVSNMVRGSVRELKKRRCIGRKTTGQMLSLRHYVFRQRLIAKATEYPGTRILTCTEEFTSKTCGLCGWQNDNLRDDKIFVCPHCKTNIDRDVHAARNIFLKQCRSVL